MWGSGFNSARANRLHSRLQPFVLGMFYRDNPLGENSRRFSYPIVQQAILLHIGDLNSPYHRSLQEKIIDGINFLLERVDSSTLSLSRDLATYFAGRLEDTVEPHTLFADLLSITNTLVTVEGRLAKLAVRNAMMQLQDSHLNKVLEEYAYIKSQRSQEIDDDVKAFIKYVESLILRVFADFH